MPENIRYQTGDSFIARKIAGESVLVPTGTDGFNGMITFNETGNFLWKKLMEGCAAEDLTAALKEEYEVSEEQAGEDAVRFLTFCLENRLLKIADNNEAGNKGDFEI